MSTIDEFCCLCLNGTNVMLTDIFLKNLDGPALFDKIFSSLPKLANVFDQNTGLSYKLCAQCCNIVDMVYQFHNACLLNIERYLLRVRPIKVEKEEEKCDALSIAQVLHEEHDLDQKCAPIDEIFVKEEVCEVDEKTDAEIESMFMQSATEPTEENCKEPEVSQNYIAPRDPEAVVDVFADLEESEIENESDSDDLDGKPKGEKIYFCHTCEKPFTVINGEIMHHDHGEPSDKKPPEVINEKEKEFPCEICGKVFNIRHSWYQHMQTHSTEKPYKCDECDKSFLTIHRLKSHKKLVHERIKSFVCHECGKSFALKHHYTEHLYSHTDEKSQQCHICHKFFKSRNTLNSHIKFTHIGKPKNLACKLCDKKYATTTNLKMHMRSHTGEKPFSCNICGKSYTRKCHLQQHLISHTGERPYSCSICHMTFARKDTYKSHQSVHTNERPHECELCNKKFRTKSNLRQHMTFH